MTAFNPAEPIPFTSEGPQPLLREVAPGAAYPVAHLGPLRDLVAAVQGMTQCQHLRHRERGWKRMLESGEFTTMSELAEHEGIAPSYMTRVLRLKLLAPDIVEAILDGKHRPEVTLARMLEQFPLIWTSQVDEFSGHKLNSRCNATSSRSLKFVPMIAPTPRFGALQRDGLM